MQFNKQMLIDRLPKVSLVNWAFVLWDRIRWGKYYYPGQSLEYYRIKRERGYVIHTPPWTPEYAKIIREYKMLYTKAIVLPNPDEFLEESKVLPVAITAKEPAPPKKTRSSNGVAVHA